MRVPFSPYLCPSLEINSESTGTLHGEERGKEEAAK
jgi:hypothetical protein